MLRSFEETEKFHAKPIVEQIMKAESPSLQTMTWYGCGETGHLVRACPARSAKTSKWCSYHKSTTHTDGTCKSQQKNKDQAKQVSEKLKENKGEEHSFAFTIQDQATGSVNSKGMLVDTGATSHIVTSDILKQVDQAFKPSKHFIELADGTRESNIALKRGDAEVLLQDVSGHQLKVLLKNVVKKENVVWKVLFQRNLNRSNSKYTIPGEWIWLLLLLPFWMVSPPNFHSYSPFLWQCAPAIS